MSDPRRDKTVRDNRERISSRGAERGCKKKRYCWRCVIRRDPTFAKFANVYRDGAVRRGAASPSGERIRGEVGMGEPGRSRGGYLVSRNKSRGPVGFVYVAEGLRGG